ncbi:type II toxin-antitoxin system HicA family toxin [Candidatus Woesearchaeota archaeon]|nr:type II toxin-antitoxin system HicA family toxin [Candidatus Woesearchaeota archaeon]
MKLPTISGKEVISLLLKQGFVIKRQRGSHVTPYKKTPERRLYVTVPLHSGKEIFPSTLLSIIRQVGMTKEEFITLTK